MIAVKHIKSRDINKIRKLKPIGVLLIAVVSLMMPLLNVNAERDSEDIIITTNFDNRTVAQDERLELKSNRLLRANEGRFIIFVGTEDLTALFVSKANNLFYESRIIPLPIGENKLTVYLAESERYWRKLAEFSLKVKAKEVKQTETKVIAVDKNSNSTESNSANTSGKTEYEFTPNLTLNIKGQNQTLTFPQDSAPERNPFTDLAVQGNILFKVSKRGWMFSNQYDFAGSSFQQEALRFGELENKAPKIDLSSYLIELSKGRFKFNLGHVSFGTNRHLINSFSSRGFTLNIPVGRQNEVSFAAANGNSIVGYGNLFGFTKRKHSVVSGTFAREFSKERPGALRVEFNLLRGSLLPLGNFNQGEINDAEKSIGLGFKVIGSTKTQRLRYQFSFTRSKFTNPTDPLLEQGFELTKIRDETKNAHYGEISFNIFQGLKLWREKKLRLTGTYRREEIAPLFRSIGVFTQADRRKNQFELTGNLGEINFGIGNLREHDNLDGIASILKTLNRRNNFIFGIPLNRFFTKEKPTKWLPVLSYTFDLTHQFGAFMPTAGLFTNTSHVPNQKNYNQVFNTQWVLSEKLNIGYAHTRTFQDNRQIGRQNADLATSSNALTTNYNPMNSLRLGFNLSRERLKSFENNEINHTFRLAGRGTWQTPFINNSTLNGGFSITLAGDDGNLRDSRNTEFDAQWTYQFSFGEKKFKKVSGQFFLRYANRYGNSINRLFEFNTLNKTQTFNAGLTFNFF